MASTATYVSQFFPKQKQTQRESTTSPRLKPFQSSKFLSPTPSSIELNRRRCTVSVGSNLIRARVMNPFPAKLVKHGVPTMVDVNSGYPIYIGSGLLDKPELLQRYVHGRVLVVTDKTIAPLYLDKVVNALTGGNIHISVETLILLDDDDMIRPDDDDMLRPDDDYMEPQWKVMDKARGHDTLVSLGGWVVGDTCAKAASLFKLATDDFIHIPTTVMAQVDSSVVGMNHSYSRRPQSVLIDTDALNTLPDRELSSGFAEVIKCALIRDLQFFQWLERNMPALMARDPSALAYAIKRSCEIKAEVVSLDGKENGLGPGLNLGHTFGNAIVKANIGHGKLLHGEAVAAGMVMAADLSHRHGWIDDSVVQRVEAILKQANLPTAPPENMTADTFKSVMMAGEKVYGTLLKFILPRGPIGNYVFTGDYDRRALDATLHKFCKS